jgi:hypothetical protein
MHFARELLRVALDHKVQIAIMQQCAAQSIAYYASYKKDGQTEALGTLAHF